MKKRVRIHSGNNIVHVFGGSSSGSRHALLAEEEADGDTPQSRLQRRRGRGLMLGTPRLLHYQVSWAVGVCMFEAVWHGMARQHGESLGAWLGGWVRGTSSHSLVD